MIKSTPIRPQQFSLTPYCSLFPLHVLIFKIIKDIYSHPYGQVCRTIYKRMSNFSGDAHLQKANPPPLSSHQLPTSSHLLNGLHENLYHLCWIFGWFMSNLVKYSCYKKRASYTLLSMWIILISAQLKIIGCNCFVIYPLLLFVSFLLVN